MAEEKKAFVVYADWETQFDLLSDDEAGKLIKHIFSYVNDKNPEFKPDERLLLMAFEPIKKQLKRDLKKYESIKEKRAEAGRKSAELRAINAQQKSTNPTSVDFVQQTSTNPTVIVTDIVKDTVIGKGIDTVIVTEREINNIEPHPQNFSSSSKQPIEILKKNCAGHTVWLEQIAMKNSISIQDVQDWFNAFVLHLGAQGKNQETEQEFKRYCASWIASELRQGRKPLNENKPTLTTKIPITDALQQSLIKKHLNHDTT